MEEIFEVLTQEQSQSVLFGVGFPATRGSAPLQVLEQEQTDQFSSLSTELLLVSKVFGICHDCP